MEFLCLRLILTNLDISDFQHAFIFPDSVSVLERYLVVFERFPISLLLAWSGSLGPLPCSLLPQPKRESYLCIACHFHYMGGGILGIAYCHSPLSFSAKEKPADSCIWESCYVFEICTYARLHEHIHIHRKSLKKWFGSYPDWFKKCRLSSSPVTSKCQSQDQISAALAKGHCLVWGSASLTEFWRVGESDWSPAFGRFPKFSKNGASCLNKAGDFYFEEIVTVALISL